MSRRGMNRQMECGPVSSSRGFGLAVAPGGLASPHRSPSFVASTAGGRLLLHDELSVTNRGRRRHDSVHLYAASGGGEGRRRTRSRGASKDGREHRIPRLARLRSLRGTAAGPRVDFAASRSDAAAVTARTTTAVPAARGSPTGVLARPYARLLCGLRQNETDVRTSLSTRSPGRGRRSEDRGLSGRGRPVAARSENLTRRRCSAIQQILRDVGLTHGWVRSRARGSAYYAYASILDQTTRRLVRPPLRGRLWLGGALFRVVETDVSRRRS